MKARRFILPLFSLFLFPSCTTTPGTDPLSKAEDSQLFAFEAATSVGLLSALETAGATTSSFSVKRAVSDTLKQTILSYLPSIEATLKGENLLTESLVTESDRPEYEIKLDIRYTDINLEETAFTMYYNQTRILDDDDWEDRFDDEEEYRIDGIVLLDGNEYTIRGEKEKEEDEMELAFWCFLDEGSYVHVKQEKERDESEFEYEIYQGGRKVHAYSLEQEDGEVELKLLDRESHDYTEMKFVDFQKEGKYYILAKLDNDRLYFQKNDDGTFSEARI